MDHLLLTYFLIVFFILLNVLLAIIVDSYIVGRAADGVDDILTEMKSMLPQRRRRNLFTGKDLLGFLKQRTKQKQEMQTGHLWRGSGTYL